MAASLAAAVKGYDFATSKSRLRRLVASSLSINPEATGDENMPLSRSTEHIYILRLNSASMVLYLVSSFFCARISC